MRNLVFAALAATALAGSASTAAIPSSEQEQIVQMLRGFIAVVEQDIEEFKASLLKTNQEQMVRNSEQLKAVQEQMVRDNAKVAEQLKVIQEQMARLIAKDSERQLRPKASAPPPQSIATSAGKQVPKLPSPQTGARPAPQTGAQPPPQIGAQPQGPVRGPSQ
jgi:hypothetical protein